MSDHTATANYQPSRQAAAAAALMSQSWFPVNPSILLHIREAFEDGRYEHDTGLLIDDLKSDAALFLYVMRELQKISKESDEEGLSLRKEIEKLGLGKMRQILTVMPSAVSHHEFRRMSDRQSQLLSENIKAACISEVLAEGQNLDRDLAFSAALLRQLGLTLIAWNYPHIYERAAKGGTSPTERDESLTKLLGFSPSTLAITIARSWELDIQYRAPLGDYQRIGKSGAGEFNLERLGRSIEKICRIGEILARASQQEYCEPRSDWHRARNEVLRTLGAQGFKLIEERVNKLLRFYKDSLPQQFIGKSQIEINADTPVSSGLQLLQANQYVRQLSTPLQDAMRALYESIDTKSVSKSSIDKLVGKIIPMAGFSKGCIYLIDPGFGWLVPRLAIGDSNLSDYKSFSPGFLSLVENPLASAYRLTTPVYEEEQGEHGSQVKFVAGAVGNLQKAGLLSLQPGEELAKQPPQQIILLFKAIRNALADCLTLA